MKINIEDLNKALGLDNNLRIENIILEYGTLLNKLENIDEQSFLFKKGLESNKKKLKSLKDDFDTIKGDVNIATLDQLISSKKEIEDKMAELYKIINKAGGLSMNMGMALNSVKSNIKYIEELLLIKSRVEKVEDIDFYFDNQEELSKLLGW